MNEQASPNFAGASAGFRRIPALSTVPTPSPSNEKHLAITGNCTDHVEVAGKRQATSLVIADQHYSIASLTAHFLLSLIADHFLHLPPSITMTSIFSLDLRGRSQPKI